MVMVADTAYCKSNPTPREDVSFEESPGVHVIAVLPLVKLTLLVSPELNVTTYVPVVCVHAVESVADMAFVSSELVVVYV